MHIAINPFHKTDTSWARGKPGSWRTILPLAIELGDRIYDGLHGVGWEVAGGVLLVDIGVIWDGSSVVADTDGCLLASLIHDLLCDGIMRADWSAWHRWRVRRAADGLYSRVADVQGMSTARAEVRWLGLRLFGWAYKYFNKE
jgi:hypothetical protein